MRLHKRRKSSRFRGSKTHRRGFKKKARGSGHRGGFGMAGSGKRGDQKKSLIINLYGNDYFKRDKALRKPIVKKLRVINLDDIERNLKSYIKQGIAKENKGAYEINLPKLKILGEGNAVNKLIIKASSASKQAVEKVKKAGGEIVLLRKESAKKSEAKPEKPVKESVK